MAILPSRGARILIVPFPAQGHMLPLLDLAHQLCSLLPSHVTITILTTPKNLPILTPLLHLHPAIETLTLPFPSHPAIPSGIENSKDMPPGTPPSAMINAFRGLYQPLLSWFDSHPSPPSVILSDFFLGWTHRLAAQVGARRIVFSPSGALAISVMYSLWRHMPVPGEDLSAEFCFDNIPKCPKYPWWQISPMYRTYRHSAGSDPDPDPDSESLKDGFKANLESLGHVINTFDDVEGVYLDNLRKELGHDRVWAVGPLVLTRSGSGSPGLDADVSRFLDTCDDDSVVYVAFGSQITLRNDQMAALAAGLEKSGVRFIWVAADGHVDGGYGAVPDGFETRVAGRGVVVRGWAPQAGILSHRASGAFLTHCGWNSVVESIVAGVPMLTWPMEADQFSDATLVVNELMVGVRVCEGKAPVPDSDELSRVLRDSVGRDSLLGSVLRERARKLKEKALEAVKDGGSSASGLNEMVRYLFDI